MNLSPSGFHNRKKDFFPLIFHDVSLFSLFSIFFSSMFSFLFVLFSPDAGFIALVFDFFLCYFYFHHPCCCFSQFTSFKNKKIKGRMLPHNISQGVIISNHSLVLQSVSRTTAGNYSCVGYNAEGDGESLPFELNVMCK